MAEVISGVQISESWKFDNRKDGVFTGDHVIDAYLKGKRDGLESQQKALLKNLNDNVDECAVHTVAIIDHLQKYNFSHDSAFLKINGWNSFNVIIAVKESDFLNPDFLKSYEYINDLEEKVCNDTYYVTFSFLDITEEVSEKNLNSDGYILKLKE